MPLCKERPEELVNDAVINEILHKEERNYTRDIIQNETMYTLSDLGLLENGTVNNSTSDLEGMFTETKWLSLTELQMIKVIVLVVVVGILLLSTCKIVFQTFSRFSGKRTD